MSDWLNFIVSPELQARIRILRILALLLILFFTGTGLYFLVKTDYLRYRWRKTKWVKDYRGFKTQRPGKRLKIWEEIQRLIKSDLLSENKLAVVKAGNLLDGVLKEAGYPTGDWEERLTQAKLGTKLDLPAILQALSLREAILQHPDQKLEAQKIRNAVEVFQKALDELRYF